MNHQFGNRIKSLRLGCSMTQEQLAQKLGVTAQAVSKWEKGTNMPDIQMLPDLSVIFGITIDDLFAMTDERRLERIENMIYDVRFLSQEEFGKHEKYLRELQTKAEHSAEAGLLLAMLYNKRANEYHELAKPLARTALQQIPGRKDAHNAIFDAENGAYQDWNCINHADLIQFYKEVTQKHPEDIRNYFWLLDLLIADCRTKEARYYAEKMKEIQHSYHYEMFMGNICRAECDLPGALRWWDQMLHNYESKWQVWFEYGSIMAKLGRYEEALDYFRKAQPMRPKPRFTDCEDAISKISEILGDIDGALDAQYQMLCLVQEDWTTEGEAVDSIHRRIACLKEMKNKNK